MILEVDVTGPALDLLEPEALDRFHVRANGDAGQVVQALGGSGRAAEDPNHVYVRIAALRELARGKVEAGWSEDFQKMLGHAASAGWVDEEGTHVMAHVERT